MYKYGRGLESFKDEATMLRLAHKQAELCHRIYPFRQYEIHKQMDEDRSYYVFLVKADDKVRKLKEFDGTFGRYEI